MTEQERRVVNHAMKILEQSQDDEARVLAVRLLERGTKVPLQKFSIMQHIAKACVKGIQEYSTLYKVVGGLRKLARRIYRTSKQRRIL